MSKFNKAYVLYANENYFDIVSTCAKSIREFSSIPIIVYLIDSNLKIDIKNCLTIKWDCNLKNEVSMYSFNKDLNFYVNRANKNVFNLFIQRPSIIKDALLNYAETIVYVDSDSIATPYIDRVFTMYPKNTDYPYFTEGIYDWMHYNGRGGAISRDDLSTTLEHPGSELFGANQYVRERYRTTNFFIAGQNSIDWISEWEWMCRHPKVLKDPEYFAPFQEETLANILLWKYNNLKGLPYVYVNADSNKVESIYKSIEFTGEPRILSEWFRIPGRLEGILVYHGEKRLDEMNKMIDIIKVNNKKNKKILFVSPHLSTGGLPQYLLKKIQIIKDQYEVHLVEYSNVSPDYIVQREQLKWILGDRFYSLNQNKFELLSIIETIDPDVVHLEEVPEMFMDNDLSIQIYGDVNRRYYIVESTHSSNTSPSSLLFYPDKFILPSVWSQNKFSNELPEIPNEVWEYPIENYYKDQRFAQQQLNFDPEYKHVLMVGLFTPGKNQSEIFEVAKLLKDYKIKFHFVGNQAPNFKEYWEPIMKDKPENCIVWGERNDVDNFYKACDLFYFSSKFELNPLSIKEALSYKMPCLFRRLETYLDSYDNNSLVIYIDNDINKTSELILKQLYV
jgi:glycosyltransferase involved in cell wall biosynthesis